MRALQRIKDRYLNRLQCKVLAAAPSVFEQLSVGFDRFCGHVPLLQNSTFRTPCPSVVNADFQFGGVVCQLNVAGLPAILEDAHMSHARGPPRGKAKIARSISLFSFGYCTSKYPAKRVSQGAPGEIAHNMSHARGPPRGKAKIARSKYPAKRVSQGAPGEIAHMGILQNRV